MSNIIFLLSLLFVGYFMKHLNITKDFAKSLNIFIIYISLPATIVLKVPEIAFDKSLISLIITPWIVLIITIFIIIFITKNYSKDVRASLLMVVPLGNTAFVGIPLITILIGENAIPYALIYDQFGSFLMLSIYGGAVIAYYESGKVDLIKLLKKIAIFPPFISLIIALIIDSNTFVDIKNYLTLLSQTLTPLALVSVGFSLSFKIAEYGSIFLKALSIKLIVMPFIAYILLLPFAIDNIVLKTAILETAMPSMITAGALAISANFAPKLSSAMVGIGLLLSLITLPIINILI